MQCLNLNLNLSLSLSRVLCLLGWSVMHEIVGVCFIGFVLGVNCFKRYRVLVVWFHFASVRYEFVFNRL